MVTPDLEGPCHLFCSPEAVLDGEAQDRMCPTGDSRLSHVFAQSVGDNMHSRTNAAVGHHSLKHRPSML